MDVALNAIIGCMCWMGWEKLDAGVLKLNTCSISDAEKTQYSDKVVHQLLLNIFILKTTIVTY